MTDGRLRTQNRGQYLVAPFKGQFTRLPGWLSEHRHRLGESLPPNLILFGEWCVAKHSLAYDRLPDWFLLFDVYERDVDYFWSTDRRNRLAHDLGITTVPELWRGRATMTELKELLQNRNSRFRDGPLEGLVIRRDNTEWCERRAKLVRADFTQAIGDHWRGRAIEWNRLRSPVPSSSQTCAKCNQYTSKM